MGDLQVGETFKHRCFIIVTATGAAATLLADVTCTIYDEGGVHNAGTVAELSHGWYEVTDFAPDAAGAWTLQWSKTADPTDYTFSPRESIFKVGGGEVTDIKTETADILGHVTTTDGHVTADYTATEKAAIDLLDDAAGGLLDIHTDVGTAISAIAVIDEFHDVPAQNAAANAQINEVIGNKTDTVAGDSLVALSKQIVADTNELQTDLVNGGRLDLLIDAIKARTDHNLITQTFFSPSQIEVIADTSHTDAALPSVTLPNITGTIVSVYAGFKFRMIENTNAAVNKLSGAQNIQVRDDSPSAWLSCIALVDDQFGLAASTREGGDCIIGNVDLVATVDTFNDIYEFQWDEPLTDQNALHFNDVQTFLIVSYY